MTVISVTAAHIAMGEPESCINCPVALAIIDAVPPAGFVWVGDTTLFLADDDLDEDTEISLPAAVRKFISAFDAGKPVRPFTFTLDYPAVAA